MCVSQYSVLFLPCPLLHCLWVLRTMQSLWCVFRESSAFLFAWKEHNVLSTISLSIFQDPPLWCLFFIDFIKFKPCSWSASYMQFYTTMCCILCVPEPSLLFSHSMVQILGCISLTHHECVSYNCGMSSVNFVPVSHHPVPVFLPLHRIFPVPGASTVSPGLYFSAQHQYLSHK